MKAIILSTVALFAMSQLALADQLDKPTQDSNVPQLAAIAGAILLPDDQLGQIKGSQVGVCVVCANIAAAIAANALSTNSTATATTGSQTLRVGTGG